MPVTHEAAPQADDLEARRRERRAEAARRRYAANKDTEQARCRTGKRRARDPHCDRAEEAAYDPQDYAEEFVTLTAWGMPSSEIIARSAPSRFWFARRVLPLVHRAICGTCGEMFSPQRAGSLVRCTKNCGTIKPVKSSDLIGY